MDNIWNIVLALSLVFLLFGIFIKPNDKKMVH